MQKMREVKIEHICEKYGKLVCPRCLEDKKFQQQIKSPSYRKHLHDTFLDNHEEWKDQDDFEHRFDNRE